jgi:hypothetical protein
MTQRVDYRWFTHFQVEHSTGSGSPPFETFDDDEPFGASTTGTGNTGELCTGMPTSAGTSIGSLDFSQIASAVSVGAGRPQIEPWTIGGAGTPFETPGGSMTQKVVFDIVDGSTEGTSVFLGRPDVTDPSHNTYFLPEQTSWNPNNTIPINRNGEMYRGTARSGTDTINKLGGTVHYFVKFNNWLNGDTSRHADFFRLYLKDAYGIIDNRTDPMQSEAEYQGYPVGGTGYPENKYWKIYGDLKGSAGTAVYEVTLPLITPGARSIGGVSGTVPDPYQGNSGSLGSGSSQLEWAVTDAIIGTDPAEGGVTSAFDYQNHDFNWFNIGIKYAASESHLYIWVP